jgi:hypothetical protein
VFGIYATDAAGEPRFAPTDSVPLVPGQEFGWFIQVGEATESVRWTETITLPGPGNWGEPGPNVSVSPDRRTAIVQSEAIPVEGLISHTWKIDSGDPVGEYRIAVRLADGREEIFEFKVERPASPQRAASPETLAEAVRACQAIQRNADIPIACEVDYIEGMPSMMIGFASAEHANDYWEPMAKHVAEPFCRAANNSNRMALVLLVVGKTAARPFICELDQWGDWIDLADAGTDI